MLNLKETKSVSHTKNLSSKLAVFTIIFNAFFAVAISSSVGNDVFEFCVCVCETP